MTRDRADSNLFELKKQARDLFRGFEVYKPMHLHMSYSVRDFMVKRPPKTLPKWAWHELHGYVEGLENGVWRTVRFAYEFDDGRVLPIDSDAYRKIERPDGSGSKWINDHWFACGYVWPNPNYLGHFSWYTYTSRKEHEDMLASHAARKNKES